MGGSFVHRTIHETYTIDIHVIARREQ